MNLRVDLILDSEKRRASVINPKLVIRVISILVPVLLGILLMAQIVVVRQLRGELRDLTRSLESAKPQQERAKAFVTEFQSHRAILEELSAWTNSLISWHGQLSSIMAVIPTNMQLRSLAVSQTFQLDENATPVRLFTTTLNGRAVGDQAEGSVRLLENALRDGDPFRMFTTNVSVPLYGADESPTASRHDRVFEIASQYNPRAIK